MAWLIVGPIFMIIFINRTLKSLKNSFFGYFGLQTAEYAKNLKSVFDYISEAYLPFKKTQADEI